MRTATSNFPSDGAWDEAEWFLRVAHEYVSPEAVRNALDTLRPIFTHDWGRALAAGATTHPIARLWAWRAAVPTLLELGMALAITGSPAQLTNDLTEASRFYTRSSEAWTGAMFRVLRASVEYLDERPEEHFTDAAGDTWPKRPEFIARWPDHEPGLAVEVKQLREGPLDHALSRVEIAFITEFTRGYDDTNRALLSRGSPRLVDDFDWQALAKRDRGEDAARDLGARLFAAFRDFMSRDPVAGEHTPAPDLVVVVSDSPPEHPNQINYDFTFPFADPVKHRSRLRRNALNSAAEKFAAFDLPGVVVLEREGRRWWPTDLIPRLANDLKKDPDRLPWVKNVAALVLGQDAVNGSGMRFARRAQILQGPRWGELPEHLRTRIPRCASCRGIHPRLDSLEIFETYLSTRPPLADHAT